MWRDEVINHPLMVSTHNSCFFEMHKQLCTTNNGGVWKHSIEIVKSTAWFLTATACVPYRRCVVGSATGTMLEQEKKHKPIAVSENRLSSHFTLMKTFVQCHKSSKICTFILRWLELVFPQIWDLNKKNKFLSDSECASISVRNNIKIKIA